MSPLLWLVLWLLPGMAAAQIPPAPSGTPSSSEEEILDVYTEHPRLFLRPARLKLLRRERERRSMRWLQFETLIAGKAPMPETGFAYALYYQVSEDAAFGREAVRWALGNNTDLRQLAIVFDWCQPLLSEAQARTLAAKIDKLAGASERQNSIAAVRGRVLAAMALAGHAPDPSQRIIPAVIRTWWRGEVAGALKAGRLPFTRDESYPLLEFLHAIRDNVNIDLRENAPLFFKDLPIYHLMSYYPVTFPAAENEFRVPAMRQVTDPDLTRSALSRAAELAMVAYDTNSPGTQVLQGWLMHDRFLMRGTFGIPYEFLWANPYQPGLSYYHVPLIFHDEKYGRLFIRSSWDDTATWLGYFDGVVQWFEDGRPTEIRAERSTAPLALPDAIVVFGQAARQFTLTLKEHEEVFIAGMKASSRYDVEVDGQEIYEKTADPGGVFPIRLPAKSTTAVRIRPSPVAK